MISRSVYEETKRDIQDHANTYTNQLRTEIEAETALHRAVQAANRIANQYHRDLTSTIFNRLREVGNNAVDYYATSLDELEKEREVSFALDELVHNKYYGLTLPQRLKQSHVVLRHNIRRSAVVGAKKETRLQNIIRVFNETYPFGAQKHWDTRLFLAEAVRLEHILAKNIAVRKSQRLARWTLSSTHRQADHCDELATSVDPRVVEYINEQQIRLKPEGVYFIEHVPAIPHPNCQCVINYVHTRKRRRRKVPKRPQNLIQRILRSIFK